MNVTEFLKIKTDYIKIGIKSILFSAVVVLLIVIEVFTFWGIYGEGANASSILELGYVDLIFEYSPILIVSLYLIYRIIKKYNNKEFVKFKTNIITLLILIILFSFRIQLGNLIL